VENLLGRYRLDDRLGQGGMGVVYRAWDTVLERVVALKLMTEAADADPSARERFFREARSAAKLTHKNIVTVYDLGEHEGHPYLAMEFLDGEDLQRRLARPEKPSFWRKVSIAVDICHGVEFAHAHGVIHRDLKPGNIFITANGDVKLLDFGLARFISSQLTQSNMLLGTINYMSPEQVRGERADQQSDVFSVGVVLYELFGGRRAFEGDSVASTLYKILQEFPEPLWKIDSSLPRELTKIIERALAKPRDERYPDAASLRRDLEMLHTTPWPVSMVPSDGMPAFAGAPAGGGPLSPPGPTAPPVLPSAPRPPSAPDLGAAQVSATAVPASAAVPGGKRGLWVGAGIGVLAVALGVVWMANRHTEPAPASASPAATQTGSAPAATPSPSPSPSASLPPATSAARPATPDAAPAPIPAPERQTERSDAGSSNRHAARPAPRTEPMAQRQTESPSIPRPPAATPAPQPPAGVTVQQPSVAVTPPSPSVPVGAPQPVPTSIAPPPPSAPTKPSAGVTQPPAAAPTVETPTLSADRANDVLQRYKAALEARSFDQLKRIWPSLGGAAEAAVRQEFQHATRITVDISDIQASATGSTGRITFIRGYSLVTTDGQRLQSTSHAAMEVHRSGDTWLIDSIRFTPQ
jgi:serine/threonine-protein kinase